MKPNFPVFLLLLALAFSQTLSAQPDKKHRGKPKHTIAARVVKPLSFLPRKAEYLFIGDTMYYRYEGKYYRQGSRGYVLVSSPITVPILPKSHIVLRIGKLTVYKCGRTYYRAIPGGYMVVERPIELNEPPPVVIPPVPAPPAEPSIQTATVSPQTLNLNIPKQDGNGFVNVVLTKHGEGYLGPQGEYYEKVPPVATLSALYGND